MNEKMTLKELQEVLGNRIRIALDETRTVEERQKDNEQSSVILGLAKQMINNGNLILNIEKVAAKNKSLEHSTAIDLIGGTF